MKHTHGIQQFSLPFALLAALASCADDDVHASGDPDSLEDAVAETIVDLRAEDRGIVDLRPEAFRTYVETRLEEIGRATDRASAAGAEHVADRVAGMQRQVTDQLQSMAESTSSAYEDQQRDLARSLALIEAALMEAGFPVDGTVDEE